MSDKTCGCTVATCGCCEGTRKLTPVEIENRPGLERIVYRAGTHATFFETMKARLSTMTVEAPGKDGQTIESFRPLEGFTTREPSDPSIALLDGWAAAGDVLTFYQERIANEGYLRTATERRSVLELARLTGYALRPGVASTVYLAYTLEDSQAEPVEIEAGRRSQSIPGPGEFPQFFETSEKVKARREWNNLKVRTQRPQNLTLFSSLTVSKIYAGGTSTGLKTGDSLLFEFGKGAAFVLRTVTKVEPDFNAGLTSIELFLYPGTAAALPLVVKFLSDLPNQDSLIAGATRDLITELPTGEPDPPETWTDSIERRADGVVSADERLLLDQLKKDIAEAVETDGQAETVDDDAALIESLLLPPKAQKRSSQALDRSLESLFASGSDNNAQLLVSFLPQLKRSYFQAWANANFSQPVADLTAVHALRASALLFGATVQKVPKFEDNVLQPQDTWDDWTLDATEDPETLYLDQAYDGILPGTYVVVASSRFGGPQRQIRRVTAAATAPRTAYGISGKSTRLKLNEKWWDANTKSDMAVLRATQVLAQSEALTLIEEPIFDDVYGQEIELAELYEGLTSGRWVIISGERTDIQGATGVRGVELHMISGLQSEPQTGLSRAKQFTTLILATNTAYRYKRDSLTIYGNVSKATHGETRQEVMGSGDGAQVFQTFSLKQSPLTFVPAPDASGVESTLAVYVNNVQWHEKETLAGAVPAERIFITKIDDKTVTSVTFGNGAQGARLPTGVENVSVIYRSGIGRAGNVRAEQISLVQTAPLGVKSVLNPLPASGGADAENREQARARAPLAVMSLDRLVSLQDYEDFARTFAAIDKASVAKLTDGRREFLHLTIAGADDIPIDPTSDLYRNLLTALGKYGDPDLPVEVNLRELIALVVSANVKIDSDYLWEPVSDAIRAKVLDNFGFARRALGQPALQCEIMAIIQAVPGVVYVDIDVFGGVPEKLTATRTGEKPARRYRTPAELALFIGRLLHPTQTSGLRKKDSPRGVEAKTAYVTRSGLIVPAQLAIFSPSVPDTLVLKQIS